ncbi:MAG: hypothetical protein ACXWWA_06915 [Chitinophagaceae bacterium]
MERPFEIIFDFPLENSAYTITLKATVQLHHSEPYYVIDSLSFDGTSIPKSLKSLDSLLPPIELQYIKTSKKGKWVHKDSERESSVSRAIGKAIEKSGRFSGE